MTALKRKSGDENNVRKMVIRIKEMLRKNKAIIPCLLHSGYQSFIFGNRFFCREMWLVVAMSKIYASDVARPTHPNTKKTNEKVKEMTSCW